MTQSVLTGANPSRQVHLIWLVLLMFAGCGGPGSELPLLPGGGPVAYSLGPGDQVRIITFGEETLTGEFRVNDSGNIALPLVGPVHAEGLTSAGLEASVGSALRRGKLVHNPSVAVEVIAYRPIYVLGEVNKPGQFAYQPGMTVVTAVAVAGGFTYRAVEGYAAIVRTVEGKAIEGKASRQSYIQPGDVITVFERRF
jgi:polysaccharide biosynthesis/export protein